MSRSQPLCQSFFLYDTPSAALLAQQWLALVQQGALDSPPPTEEPS